MDHTIDVITPEVVDALPATAVQLNPERETHGVIAHEIPPRVVFEPREPGGPIPPWMVSIVRRQWTLAKRYQKAREQALEAYNEALMAFEEINAQYGTNINLENIVQEFGGGPAL